MFRNLLFPTRMNVVLLMASLIFIHQGLLQMKTDKSLPGDRPFKRSPLLFLPAALPALWETVNVIGFFF